MFTFQVGGQRRRVAVKPLPPHAGYRDAATHQAALTIGEQRLSALAEACMILAEADYGAGGTRQRVIARWLLASCLRYWGDESDGADWEGIASRAVKRAP